jgi:AcrR family transcriptional regulator
MARAKRSKSRQENGDETAVRKRILQAAFATFTKSGYAAASTLEIATRVFLNESFTRSLATNRKC